MKAIILQKPCEFEHITKEQPLKPAPGQVLLKIKKVSICGTDLHAYKGEQPFFSYPRILGHEIAAQVIEAGEGVFHLQPGDLCNVEPYRNAVIDQAVKRGMITCGSKLTVLGVHEDGGLQEYIIYDAGRVHACNELTADQAAIVEPFAIGSHAVERAEVQANDIVLVAGAGPIGIAAAAMATLKGARVIAMDVNQYRLGFVTQHFSKTEVLLYKDTIVNDLQFLLNGDLPTIVIDATGNKHSMARCFDYVVAGGTIVFVGLFQGDLGFHDPLFHRKELTLKASRAAMPEDFKKVIAAFKNKAIDTSGYITHRIAFDHLANAFEKLYDPGENVIKAIVDFD